MPYLIDPRLPADLPVMVYPATRERIGQVPRFGLIEAELTGRGHGRRLNPCDNDCRLEIEPILEARGLTVRDLCSRGPRGPREPVEPVEAAPLGEAGITTNLVEAGSRRLMVAAAIADDVIAACLPEVVGQRIAGPDKTVLLGVSGDKWVVGATKQIKAGVRAIEKQLRAPVIVEFAPLVADSPEEQAYNVIALQRLATIATDAELTRGGVSWPVMLGAETEVLIAGASGMERLPARYLLAPFPAILPSNSPQSFAPSPDYPRELQERDYQTDQAERAKVITNAQNWIPALVLNSNPDAVNGPPIVDTEGRVLGGNSRAMSTARHAAANPDAYAEALRQALRNHCAAFGLDGVELDNATLAGLVLVRVIEGQIDPRTISRALNRALTLELGRGAASVTMGRLIPPALLAQLAEDVTDSTLREILRANSQQVISALRKSGFITAQNAPVYVQRTGELTNRAAQDIEDALTGLFVGSTELYNTIKPRLLAVVTRVAPGLLALADSADYAPDIEDARAALSDATAWLGLSQVELDREVTTGALFESVDRVALTKPAVARWVLWWMQSTRSPAVAARVVRDFVALANEEPGLFGPRGRDVDEMIRVLKMQPFDTADPAQAWAAYVREGLPFEGLQDRKRNPAEPGHSGDRASYVPPRAVQEAAALALAVRAASAPSERGGTSTGLARARDLAHGRPVSRETLARMVSFFARHEIDKRGASWPRRGKGWQAWHLWGGDAGRDWARGMLDERRDNPPRVQSVKLKANQKIAAVTCYMEPLTHATEQRIGLFFVSDEVKTSPAVDAFDALGVMLAHVARYMAGLYFHAWAPRNTPKPEFLGITLGDVVHNPAFRDRAFYLRDHLYRIGTMPIQERLEYRAPRPPVAYAVTWPTGENTLFVWPYKDDFGKDLNYQHAALFFLERPERETLNEIEKTIRAKYAQTFELEAHTFDALQRQSRYSLHVPAGALYALPADEKMIDLFETIATQQMQSRGHLNDLYDVIADAPRAFSPAFRVHVPIDEDQAFNVFQIQATRAPYTKETTFTGRLLTANNLEMAALLEAANLAPVDTLPEPSAATTKKPRKTRRTISAADVLDAPAPLDVLDEPGALDALDEPGPLDAPAVARLDREAEREAVAEFAPLARRRGRHERRTYTAQDVRDDVPPPRPQPDRDTMQAALVRKVLRGVGAWAQSHPDDDTARELGGILIALAAESQLAERGARAGVTVGDQAFAHMYWAAHPPTEPDKWNAGLVAAAQAAILLAKGETQAAIDMLSPTRRPNPIPVWAETLLQLARLITALSAASSAGIAINQTALAGDATLATLDTGASDTGNTDATGGR
jgi:hypothetical protein